MGNIPVGIDRCSVYGSELHYPTIPPGTLTRTLGLRPLWFMALML
jgi:hypothetical protein